MLLLLGCGAVTLGVVNIGAFSTDAVRWLLDRHVLVPANQAMIDLPGGAGLDLHRLVLLTGLVVLAGAVLVTGRRRTRDQ